MFRITKRIEIAGAHSLDLPYESKCKNLHGHNWIIEVEVESEILDENGMVIDFTIIKNVVMKLDHKNLNDVFQGCHTTAENIAAYIHDALTQELATIHQGKYLDGKIPFKVSKVIVQESEGNTACYIP